MFNYNQPNQIANTAISKKLELWQAAIEDDARWECNNPYPRLILDNLFPWLDKIFGEIENPFLHQFKDFLDELSNPEVRYIASDDIRVMRTIAQKLKQQATKLYFLDPQELADLICKAMEKHL